MGVKRTTAYSIIKIYLDREAVEYRRNGGRRSAKTTQRIQRLLDNSNRSNPTISIRELNVTLRDIFPRKPHVSDSTVARHLMVCCLL